MQLRADLQAFAIEPVCLAEDGKPTGACPHLEDPHPRLHLAQLADESQVSLVRRNLIRKIVRALVGNVAIDIGNRFLVYPHVSLRYFNIAVRDRRFARRDGAFCYAECDGDSRLSVSSTSMKRPYANSTTACAVVMAPSSSRRRATPEWLPPAAGRSIFQERFLAMENGEVRGGYALKHQDFSFRGVAASIACYHSALSEGVAEESYRDLDAQLLTRRLDARAVVIHARGGPRRPNA